MKPLYLAGPMTGYPQFNYPAFHRIARTLRSAGIPVISPAETDNPAVQQAAMSSEDGKLAADGTIGGHSWGQLMAKDVQTIADTCGGLVLLKGWGKSRGARLEAFTGLQCKHKFFECMPFEKEKLVEIPATDVLFIINHHTRFALQ